MSPCGRRERGLESVEVYVLQPSPWQSILGLISHGLISHGLISHGLISHGPISHGLISHGPISHGPISHGLISHGLAAVIASTVMIVMTRRLVDLAIRTHPFIPGMAKALRRLGFVILVGGLAAELIRSTAALCSTSTVCWPSATSPGRRQAHDAPRDGRQDNR